MLTSKFVNVPLVEVWDMFLLLKETIFVLHVEVREEIQNSNRYWRANKWLKFGTAKNVVGGFCTQKTLRTMLTQKSANIS